MQAEIEIHKLQSQKVEMQTTGKLKAKKGEEKEPDLESCNWFQGDTETGKKINDVLNGAAYAIFSTVVLLVVLFADDIRQIAFPVSADLGFTILTLCCMIYYGVQITILTFVQKEYFLGYYFWLDVISTLTMAFDLIWISQYLTGGGQNAASISQISRASRAARLGTRTVKLIRLIRMVKLLKQMKSLSHDIAKNQKDKKPSKSGRVSRPVQPSRISKVESRLASIRNLQVANSLRNMERIPSKRWSLIKDVNCVGPEPIPIHVSASVKKTSLISMSMLPYNNPDRIIDRDDASESNKSGKSISIQRALSKNKIDDELSPVEPTNQHMVIPIFQESKAEKNNSVEDENENEKKSGIVLINKKVRLELLNKKQSPTNGTQTQILIPPESKVGAKVQQDVQKNVISMIILILLSIPLLDGATWFSSVTIYQQAQSSLIFFAQNYPSQYQANANLFVESGMQFDNPLLYFNINTGTISDRFPDNYVAYAGSINHILANTRSDDIELSQGSGFTVAYDISWYNKQVSYFNISRTIFVCLLLIITTIFFSHDLDVIAVSPLEEMMNTVRKLAVNPLNAVREIEQKNMCLQKIEEEEGKLEVTEPQILQNTILKISKLLAIGFGQAGTQIICKVIEDPTAIDAMIPGQKIMAIFGFCDIRNFTDATEVLEADVMVFVNQIAAICHKEVYEHLGSPNKNIGDAFLLVWKFSQEDVKVTKKENEDILELIPSRKVSQMADLAVLSLVNMTAAIARSQTLQKYKNNARLKSRIPDYFGPKMGFGLHVGWAIEGPIGSQYKIDASYLGPDVHMASRLEGATKGYGTGMLITSSLYDLMTENKSYLRRVDRVIPDGDTEMIDLYTVDLNPRHLFQQLGVEVLQNLTGKEKKMEKLEQATACKNLQQSLENNSSATVDLWNDEQIKIMMEEYSTEFYREWSVGFDSYLKGHWEDSIQQLTLASSLGPNGVDGPSQSLLKYMNSKGGSAPKDWKGYRGFQ